MSPREMEMSTLGGLLFAGVAAMALGIAIDGWRTFVCGLAFLALVFLGVFTQAVRTWRHRRLMRRTGPALAEDYLRAVAKAIAYKAAAHPAAMRHSIKLQCEVLECAARVAEAGKRGDGSSDAALLNLYLSVLEWAYQTPREIPS